MTKKSNRFSRRTVALFWCLAVAIIIAALIVFEQIALLYVLATLGLVLLLLIVGFSDLEKVGQNKETSSAAEE
jgi:choline-glycine betaine transporter